MARSSQKCGLAIGPRCFLIVFHMPVKGGHFDTFDSESYELNSLFQGSTEKPSLWRARVQPKDIHVYAARLTD